ncbi:MAG TPA: membrane protein insertase YidC [Gemmatimonadales bacterium]|jgi:YidC/Oxa1 family membrane protein insertase
MERRVLIGIGLMLLVAVLPSILFPPEPRAPSEQLAGDSAQPAAESSQAAAEQPERQRAAVSPAATVRMPPQPEEASDIPERMVTVESPLYRFTFASRGARPVEATLQEYRSFAPGDSGSVQLLPDESTFLQYALVVGNDTLPLGEWDFEPSAARLDVVDSSATLEWLGRRGAIEVRLRYTFEPSSYGFHVEGSIVGGPANAAVSGVLLLGLGPRIAGVEADSVDDFRSYAVVTKAGKTESVKFSSLDPFERMALDGPYEWIAIRSKYFVVSVMTLAEGAPRLGGAIATGGRRTGRTATDIDVVATLPVPSGSFRFAVFAGPQQYRRLANRGHDFEDIKPYGGIFRPIIRPFANFIVLILLWMHETLNLAYGWVLVLFGLAVRILLWPLNQKAMRSSMAMQAIQPEMKALQERYKNDQQRLQQEMMKLYKEHQVNPLGGCLPLLIPMPVLFALFFVFRETIEFRGVSFLWLPDLSRADPLFIIPILMGLSMFAVTKLGQRGVPPNPQAKMMMYLMPGILTFVFLRLSSGLNLYYAVSNIASIPQQWLISKERERRRQPSGK